MKKISLLFVFALAGTLVMAQKFEVNADNSTVNWKAQKVTKKGHYGTVGLKEGSFELVDNKFASGKFVIDMKLITDEDHPDPNNTGRLISHLKSDDFFSVDKYPEAILVIKGSEGFKGGKAKVNGDLTIKGITKPLEFVVERVGSKFSSSLIFDRSVYDVRFGSGKFFENLGDNRIEDEVQIDVSLIAERQREVNAQ